MDIEKHAAVIFGNMKKHLTNKYMKKLLIRLSEFWWFTFRNPVVRKGESKDGAFRWTFRRFTMDISTLSGNFKARFTADAHPYAYLLAGKDDENIIGFSQLMYSLGMLLTQDRGLADDVAKAINKYQKRLEKKAASGVVEDETEEKVALEEVKAVQEHVDLPKKERRKVERGIDGRFKKAVKDAEKKGV